MEESRADFGSITGDERLTADEMDNKRSQAMAYEYLCHLEEAKQWMEYCLQEELPPSTELEESLRNGVSLAKLGHYFASEVVPARKIYDKDLKRFQQKGLHFKHTDNINRWFRAMEHVGLPEIFYPETTDIYDRKNMPRTIYCLHALSLYLFKLGKAPQMKDLYGIAEFTEEQVTIMQTELEKYGIQLPQFNKIGGILANEMSVDEASLHAAVIAINEALEAGDVADTCSKLLNPQAHLEGVNEGNAEAYQERLLQHKRAKVEASQNKNKDKSMDEAAEADRDMYEELLTHAELQGNLSKINVDVKLEKLNVLLRGEDIETSSLVAILKELGIANVEEGNETWYRHQLIQDLDAKKEQDPENDSVLLVKEEIQSSVTNANQLAAKHRFRKSTVANINTLLSAEDGEIDAEKLMKFLLDPEAGFPEVFPDFPAVHFNELLKARNEKGSELTHDEIAALLPRLNALARLNKELVAGDVSQIWAATQQPELGLEHLDENFRTRICDALVEEKKNHEYLNIEQVQGKIDCVNAEIAVELARVEGVNELNDALDGSDVDAMLKALQNPALKLENVDPANITHYIRMMKRKKDGKRTTETDDEQAPALWIDEIQETIDLANQQTKVALKQASAVAAVNMAIEDSDWEQSYEMLKHPDLAITALTFECGSTYYDQFKVVKEDKLTEGKVETDWVMYKTREGDDYYFNIDTLDGTWDKPEQFNPDTTQLSKEEIQSVVNDVSAAYDRCQFYKDNENQIVKLQSFGRMCIAKRRYNERKNFMDNQLPAIVTIQSAWRGHVQRKKYADRLKHLHDNAQAVVTLQKYVRMWKLRRAFQNRLNYLKDQNKSIVKLQAWFRSNKARHDYKTLIGVENPPLPVVRRFVHLLDQRATDFAEEIELQELKKSVIQRIKANNDHEKALNTMDIKIGLLVKNRISLQDVINHSHNLRKKAAKDIAAGGDGNTGLMATGLKALNKANRARLEAYQHLFYMLQTNPTYFGKLIFKMPVGRSTDFMQQVIFAVYNYASNSREEYLLLKLFRTALQEEIDFIAGEDPGSKVDKVKEIATGNPLVIKMVVSFNRGAKGNSSLRQILAPQVSEVLKKKSVINTSPIEIYKAWISQREMETGEASDLPYNVTTEQAYSHKEVISRMEDSLNQLRQATDGFMNAICNNIDQIPYGLRYIAKCLRNLLTTKFPETPDEEVLKMVGNLIYYRFINPAIISPDVFDIIDVTAGNAALNTDQRRNLGSIAKVLQFASTGKSFVDDHSHMDPINQYMKEAYERFKTFFKAVCDVPEPEEKHNMDEFSDAVLLVKPVIFISLKEVVDTHKLLVEHEEEIAPDGNDPLHDMLEELGDVPDYSTLLGTSHHHHRSSPNRESKKENHQAGSSEGDKSDKSAGDNDKNQDNEAIKAEISLTLASRVEIQEDDDSDVKNLLLRTKRMVIDIIRIQGKENLKSVLNTPATDEQEELHMANISKLESQKRERDEKENKDDEESVLKTRSLLNENKLPLEDMKRRVLRNLEKLEGHEIVSQEDNYQSIVNMIARDIRNQRRYRQRRKQELSKLKQNEERLEQKSKSLEEQSEYFNQYIKSCLSSLTAKSKQQKKKKKKAMTIKYTAMELYRKKIVLEVEGLDQSKFRDVLFEISQNDDDAGKFVVAAKFCGLNMDKVTVVFQDLLQLQYEGVNHMKMFEGRARVNVNLLIFLLNKKFFGK